MKTEKDEECFDESLHHLEAQSVVVCPNVTCGQHATQLHLVNLLL